MYKNILFVVDHLKGGGAEKITLDVAEKLYLKGYRVSIISLAGDESKMMPNPNIAIFYMNFPSEFFSGGMWRKRNYQLDDKDKINVQNVILKINPDKIILGYWYGYFIEPVIPKQYEIILWFHGQAFDLIKHPKKNLFRRYKEWRRWYLEKKGFLKIAKGKKLIFVNEDLKKECEPLFDSKDLFVLPNGVNIDKIHRQTLGVDKKEWDCIFVGRLSPEKQPSHAIRAFANSGSKGKMVVVGDGELNENLKNLCQILNIADRVDFVGWQENPYSYIARSRVLVLSSITEGSPLIVAEAIALNVPVVAYNINSGIRQQLGGELSMGLVENQDLDKLTQKLGEIIHKPYAIKDKDIQRLSLNSMVENFESIISID